MNAARACVFLAAVLLLATARADDRSDPAAEKTKILVTFADPGMSNAARPGPVRPGYNRKAAGYLVSVRVKRAANRVAHDFGLEVVDEWPIVPLAVHCLVYAVGKDVAVEPLLERLRTRPEVESAQRLNRFEVSGEPAAEGEDPYSGLQHNLDTLELAQAHAWSQGDGADVTIIDTGADFRHPDLATQIRTHRDFVGDGDSEFARDAHGTAVAGVIGAASGNGVGMTGIAPAASLAVLRACWYAAGRSRAVCDSFTLAKALAHAVETDTDVINLSLGGPSDALLGRLVALALERGVAVVAAAPAGAHPGFPADVPGVIVVDSVPVAGGAPARFVAPGDEILVPVPGGGFDYASGSSLSAAQVSGIVALLVSARPGLGGDDVNRLLVSSRDGGVSVNACRALAHLLHRSGCRDDSAARIDSPDLSERGAQGNDEPRAGR